MKTILFALMTMFISYTAFAQHTNNLVNNYITLKNALISGDSKAASAAAIILQESIKGEGDFSGKDVLLKAADKMASASGLENQRGALNELSTSLWTVVKAADKGDATIYYQYCPMKKGYWLSETAAVKNPYYGNAMLSCGKVVESK